MSFSENKTLKKTDKFIDAFYLSGSMNDYWCAVNSPKPLPFQLTDLSTDSFYQADDWFYALLRISIMSGLAFLAAQGESDKESADKRPYKLSILCANYWPYLRDLFSGLKNGRYAVVHVSAIAEHFLKQSLYGLANPIGVVCGIFLALTLVWCRWRERKRLANLKNNKNILAQLQSFETIKKSDLELMRKNIVTQSLADKACDYLSAGFDGLTDGAYLFGRMSLFVGLGLMSVPSGAPLIIITVAFFAYVVLSILFKLEQVYHRQLEIKHSALACEQAIEKLLGENKSPLPETISNSFDITLLSAQWYSARGIFQGIKNMRGALIEVSRLIHQVIIIPAMLLVLGTVYAGYKSFEAQNNILKSRPPCLSSQNRCRFFYKPKSKTKSLSEKPQDKQAQLPVQHLTQCIRRAC